MSAQAKLLKIPAVLAGQADFGRTNALEAHQFLRLYDEYFARVYNYARYRCSDAATADDLTALTFERAFSRLGDYNPERGPFGAWLFAIARNVVNNHLRAEMRRNWVPLEFCGEQTDQADSPEERLIQRETQDELLAALALLSGRERDLLSLKFAAGLSNRRIAEITGLSESNVGVVLYRAIRRLRVTVEQFPEEEA